MVITLSYYLLPRSVVVRVQVSVSFRWGLCDYYTWKGWLLSLILYVSRRHHPPSHSAAWKNTSALLERSSNRPNSLSERLHSYVPGSQNMSEKVAALWFLNIRTSLPSLLKSTIWHGESQQQSSLSQAPCWWRWLNRLGYEGKLGALIIRIGLWGQYTIILKRNPK